MILNRMHISCYRINVFIRSMYCWQFIAFFQIATNKLLWVNVYTVHWLPSHSTIYLTTLNVENCVKITHQSALDIALGKILLFFPNVRVNQYYIVFKVSSKFYDQFYIIWVIKKRFPVWYRKRTFSLWGVLFTCHYFSFTHDSSLHFYII